MLACPLKRQDGLVALALAAVVLAAGTWRMAPGVCGKLHDDAIYVSTAKALSSGQGYRQIHLPDAPLQTKYPILYPAVLAAVWHVWPTFPENLVALHAVGVVCAASAVALAYLYLVRFDYCSRTVAAGCGLVCGVAPLFLYYAVHTMAEMPFAVLMIVALWGIETTLLGTPMTRRSQFLWGAALALPFLCRTIGAVFIVSGLFVIWRHQRPLRWYASGAVLAAAPWVLWSLQGCGGWQQNPIDGYYTDYLGSWTSTGGSLVWPVIRGNSLMTAFGTSMLWLEGIAGPLESWLGPVAPCAALLLAGLVPWAAMMPDLAKARALPWMLLAYLAAMLIWPWPPLRFVVPILPFLVAYFCLGCVAAVKPWKDVVNWRLAGVGSLGLIAAANVVLLAAHGAYVRTTGFPVPRFGDTPISWSSYERLFSWLEENSQEQDIIAAGMDSMIALYTDRRAFRPFAYDPGHLFYGNPHPAQSSESLAAVLQRYQPAYLVLSPTPDLTDETLVTQTVNELRARYPDWLEIAYQDEDPRFLVFKLCPQYAPAKVRPAIASAH